MANSADPDQLASEEANWSGSTLFAKAGHIRVQQDKGWAYNVFNNWTLVSFTPLATQILAETVLINHHICFIKQRITRNNRKYWDS